MDGKTNVYDKTVDDLQSDIVIDDESISGTLKHVTDYVGFNASNNEEQSGNYLALKVEVPEGAKITTRLINGKKGTVDLTNDKFCVYRITNKDNQKVEFTVTKGDESLTKTYGLTNLVVDTE